MMMMMFSAATVQTREQRFCPVLSSSSSSSSSSASRRKSFGGGGFLCGGDGVVFNAVGKSSPRVAFSLRRRVKKKSFSLKAQHATTAFSSSPLSSSSSSSVGFCAKKNACNNKRRERRGDLSAKTNAINLRYSLESSLNTLANLFPLWIVLGALVGLFNPTVVAPLSKSEIVTPALGIAMLGMGVTLDEGSLRQMLSVKGSARVFLGSLLQFTIMPLLGFFVGQMFGLEKSARLGLILVGCCPGGAASNVVAFLANANVSLSVALTTLSTCLAAFATPFLTSKLMAPLLLVASSKTKGAPTGIIEVDSMAMVASVAQVVVLPVIAGFALKKVFPRVARIVSPVCPLLAVGAVALICSSVIGKHSAAILSAGHDILFAVICLHALGFMFGYIGAKIFGFPSRDARTASIEVGMQNSALGVVLAAAHFAKDPLVAVVPAISATVHSCLGSMLAGYWRFKDRGGSSSSDDDDVKIYSF
jgi:bile acid:Na+ symporter, BASS family